MEKEIKDLKIQIDAQWLLFETFIEMQGFTLEQIQSKLKEDLKTK